MSNERPQPDRDLLVTELYSEIATRETPEHLDRAILDRARGATRPKYALLRLWSRPLAWAMTIVLSVSLVLHLTSVPETPVSPEIFRPEAAGEEHGQGAGPGRSRQADETSSGAEELVPLDTRLLQDAEDMARMQSGPQQRPEVAPATAVTTLEKKVEAAYCDTVARSTRSSWRDCIEKLESEGRLTEALAEKRAFELAYPEE